MLATSKSFVAKKGIKRYSKGFKHVWLPVLAILSTTLAGALLMAALFAPGVEPFNKGQEMASFALAVTAVHWIIFFAPTIVLFRLSHAGKLECSKPLFNSPAFNRAAIWFSTYLSVFAVCQLVLAARDRADLIQGRPDWIFDPTFDWLGSPILLVAMFAIAASKSRKAR